MRRLVRCFDALIRRGIGVIEFTQHPDCLLRVQFLSLGHELVLPDVHLPPGAPALAFHLWNERVPALPPGGADLAWARVISRRLIRSFHFVHSYLASQTSGPRPEAIGGTTVLGFASGESSDVLAHLGFHPIAYRGPWGRFGERWENAYTWALMWAYNPASLRGKRLGRMRRTEYWMSASAFFDRFPAA
jgi:hypothetical protein